MSSSNHEEDYDDEEEYSEDYEEEEDSDDESEESNRAGETAIGIDLGTTYCCVAVFKNGRAEVILITNLGSK